LKKVLHELDGITFDSSWELAFYIYLRDYGIPFEYHPDIEFPYKLEEDDEKFHIYRPDFKIHDKLIEIKGNHLAEGKDKDKLSFLDRLGVDVITGNDIKPFLNYVAKKYGKGYLLQCRKQTVEVTTASDTCQCQCHSP
jgi:hypothetical protein